jgi:hypothetical protein
LRIFNNDHRYISRCILGNSSARQRWSKMIVSHAKFLCDFEIQGVGNILYALETVFKFLLNVSN